MASLGNLAKIPLKLAGGIAEGLGISGASDAGEDAAELMALQEYMRQQELKPYKEAGAAALGQFQSIAGQAPSRADFMANFQADPGLQFELQQGRELLEGGAAARGNLLSGRTLKELQEFGQGLASTRATQALQSDIMARQAQLNPLQVLMGQGLQTLAPSQTAAMNNAIMAQGEAQAFGKLGTGQAISGTLGSIADDIGGGGGGGFLGGLGAFLGLGG